MKTLEHIKSEVKDCLWKLSEGNTYLDITREEVENAILEIIDKYAEQKPTDEWQDGYDMAWELAEVFYEEEPCDDVISRQEVLDNLSELNVIGFYEAQEDSKETYYEIRKMVENLPSVNLQEPKKTGHWILDEDKSLIFNIYKCSNCENIGARKSKYCPNCGAKMKNI